jgi:uncharacterized protein YukE
MTAVACYAPPKGDPGALRAAAAVWSAMGGELSTLGNQVGGAEGMVAGSWKGAGASAFASASAGHANHLQSLAGHSSEMASVLSQAARLIEQAQQEYRAQMQRIAAAAHQGPSVGDVVGMAAGGVLAVGAGVAAVGTSWIPGVDVGTGAAFVASDAAEASAATAATAAEAAAAASEVAAASSAIGEAISTLTTGMQAVAQEIASIGGRFAEAFGKLPMPIQYGVQGGAATAASQEIFTGHVNLSDVAVEAAGNSIGGFLPFMRAVQYGVGSGLGTAAQQVNDTGTISSPASVAEWTALGAVGGGLEEHVLPSAHAGAQAALDNGVKHGLATAATTFTIHHFNPK